MAHFARISDDNIVQEVIVVNNNLILDGNGDESEAAGQAFLSSLGLSGTWLQCSYNGNVRGSYPGHGWVYDPELDEFVFPVATVIEE